MNALVTDFHQWERTFNSTYESQKIFVDNADFPMYAVMAYLAMVFWGQHYMKDRAAFNLKPLFIAWNFLLATFSIVGATIVVPGFLYWLQKEGLRFTVCEDSREWWNYGPVGVWMMLFCLSKVPELVDTAFLVLQKKPVIFLHWFHHTTVLLFCWYSYTHFIGIGIWFGAMNYVVHSIMYSYYFLMSLSGFTRKIVKPIGKLITVLQIAQMVVGMYVVWRAHFFQQDAVGCNVSPVMNRAGLVMYTSYFVLFAKFFVENYVLKKSKRSKLE
jgi:elongation of very long chain fatty acids protein 6